jgi:hypothetical protein
MRNATLIRRLKHGFLAGQDDQQCVGERVLLCAPIPLLVGEPTLGRTLHRGVVQPSKGAALLDVDPDAEK